jgi:hypothetical protein
MVVERIVGLTAGSPDAHEARASQESELVGDGRFAEADESRQVADAAFAMAECVDDPHPCGVAEQLEDIGNRMDRSRRQQACGNVGQRDDVGRMSCLAGVVGGRIYGWWMWTDRHY